MAGVWAIEDGTLTIEPFKRVGKAVKEAAEAEAARLPHAPAVTLGLTCAPRRRSSPSPPPTGPAGAGSAPPSRSASASSSSTARSRPASPIACTCRSTTRSPTTSRSATRSAASRRRSRCCPNWRARWSRRACWPARTTGARPRTLIREHTDGGAVILGRAGAVILREHPEALHVRLDGPPARRIERAMELEGPLPRRRRAPAPRRRPGARGLRAPLLQLRRTRPRALSPRDRLDRVLHGDRGRGDRCRYALNSGRITPRASVWKARLKPTNAGETSSLMSSFSTSSACTANT